MKILYDPRTDALYIEFWPVDPGQAENRERSAEITANYDRNGRLVGIEILDASVVAGSNLQRMIIEMAPLSWNPVKNVINLDNNNS